MKLKVSDSIKHIQKPLDADKLNQLRDKSKMVEAAEGFESLFTSMMLKSMTKTAGSMFGENNFGGDFFDTVFQMRISQMMADNQNFGVAESLFRKMTGEDLEKAKAELNAAGIAPDKELNMSRLKQEASSIIVDKAPGVRKESFNDASVKDESAAIKPANKTMDRVDKFDNFIDAAAQRFGVNKNLIKSVIFAESAGNYKAISPKKAKGLMQLIDSTASDMGVKNVWDPKDNIFGGTRYLSGLLKKYNGDVKLSLAAYNAGPGNVDKHNGVPPFEETKNYVNRVMGYYNYLEG